MSRLMDRAVPTQRLGGEWDHARTEREFARARRHSRLVAVLKIGLPLLAFLIVAGGLTTTWIARNLPDNVSLANTSIENGRLVMQDPRMSGYDENDKPYTMIARRAFQSLDGSGIDLEGVRANVSVKNDITADILAAKGHYEAGGKKLKLFEGIKVDTSDGMAIALDTAEIDLASGGLTTEQPVRIRTPNQTIEAGRMTVHNSGKFISFGKKVRMTLLPSSGDGSAARPSESP